VGDRQYGTGALGLKGVVRCRFSHRACCLADLDRLRGRDGWLCLASKGPTLNPSLIRTVATTNIAYHRYRGFICEQYRSFAPSPLTLTSPLHSTLLPHTYVRRTSEWTLCSWISFAHLWRRSIDQVTRRQTSRFRDPFYHTGIQT
jgi:hypothetical protein